MIIRWIGTEMRLFAFYRNFALIAAFLGLGIGFALQRRDSSNLWFDRTYFPMLAVLAFMVVVLGRTQLNEVILFNQPNPQEYFWTRYTSFELRWAAAFGFYVVLFTTTIVLVLTFIPIGKLIASDAVAGDRFGGAVAISGNTAIVSAIGDDDRTS